MCASAPATFYSTLVGILATDISASRRRPWNKFVVIARNPFCILGQQQIRPPRQLALLEMSYSSGWGFKRGAFGTIRNVWLEMRWHSAHLSIGPDEWINLPIRKRSRVFPFEHLRGAAAFLYV
jgi:hypothetical protein